MDDLVDYLGVFAVDFQLCSSLSLSKAFISLASNESPRSNYFMRFCMRLSKWVKLSLGIRLRNQTKQTYYFSFMKYELIKIPLLSKSEM